MGRPRKAETRNHQINLRFTAPELVRIHSHAALTGKTLTDFGRSVLLRRPRRKRGRAPAAVIAWSHDVLARWHALGMRLNDVAHAMNARDGVPPAELLPLLAQLRALLRKSLSPLPAANDAPSYTLAPPVRHHLRKVGVNLAQIDKRLDALGLDQPTSLVRLLQRIRTVMNGDQPPHAA